jgi:peptidoglycan/xylan/chitin deacetylase (PgdA/CDA1 family)
MHAILSYHSVDTARSPLALSEAELRRHLYWLASGKVQCVPLEWLPRVPAERDALSLTFDDGYADFADLAWPVFRHNDLPVTLFVVSARAGGASDWGGGTPVRPLLGWDALVKLVDKGLVLGSHSRTHRDLTALSDAELEDEVAGSADEIEKRTGVRPKCFSHPFGKSDERVRAVVARHYQLACGQRLGVLSPGEPPFDLPRLDAHHFRDPKPFGAWGKPAFRRALAWRGLRRRFSSLPLS